MITQSLIATSVATTTHAAVRKKTREEREGKSVTRRQRKRTDVINENGERERLREELAIKVEMGDETQRKRNGQE